MNNGLFLVPGRNSRALYHTFYNTTKRVRVAEDNMNEYPVVALKDMNWYLVHKNLVMNVDLKLHEGHWYIIPGIHINYSNVSSWDYQDVRDMDHQPSTDLVLDAFITYDKSDNKYHITEQSEYRGGQIFLPAEEIWNTPNVVRLPNVVRNLIIAGQYDGKGVRSQKLAYDGFAAILKDRGMRYCRQDIEALVEHAAKFNYLDEISFDFNRRFLTNKRIPDMKLRYEAGCICGDSDEISIRLQYGSKYHTDHVVKLLNI